MAIKTISIGNMEDWHQYDDTELYSDSSVVQGIRADTMQVATAPTAADDVMRLDDVILSFNPFWQSPVVDKDLTAPPI